MYQSESVKNIQAALVKAQANMPKVVMDATNPYYKSRYATLGAVISASRPILAQNGLAIVQFPVSQGVHTIGVETVLMHESGEYMGNTIVIPTEQGAKNPAQEAGIIISYLRRYGWAAVLGLYAEEDTDGNDVGKGASAPKKADADPSGWPTAILEMVMAKYGPNIFEARNALKLSKELDCEKVGPKGVDYWYSKYTMYRKEDKMEPADAANQADFDYVAEKNRRAQDAATGG